MYEYIIIPNININVKYEKYTNLSIIKEKHIHPPKNLNWENIINNDTTEFNIGVWKCLHHYQLVGV